MANGSKRLAVFIGAGASHDCGGLSDVVEDWKPPLVKELFASRRASFNVILHKYTGVENLAHEIRSGLGTEGLEQILRRFAVSENPYVRMDYRQVPLYLQEVLGDVSTNYIRSGATAFMTLVRGIDTSAYTQVCYLTVNYDLFLDHALERHYKMEFQSLESYAPLGNKWSLVKLHGSVNWGRPLQNGRQPPFTDPVMQVTSIPDEPGGLILGDTIVLPGYRDGHRIRDNFFHYPALAVPIGDKDGFLCDKEQVTAATDFLSGCSDFLFIGLSGLDSHVLSLLKGVSCVGNTAIVNNTEPDGKLLVQRLAEANPLFGSASIEPTGFNAFISGGSFRQFLERASKAGPT